MADEVVYEDPQASEASTVASPEVHAAVEMAEADELIILDDISSPEELERLYEESLKHIKEGEIVRGRIVHIDRDVVLVDVGYKSEHPQALEPSRPRRQIRADPGT